MLDLSFSDSQFSSLLRTFIASTNDTVLILDARRFESGGDAMIVYANQSALRVSGYLVGELIGQRLDVLYPPERRSALRDQLLAAARAKGPLETEGQALTKDGKLYWMLVTTTAAFTPSGELSHFIRMGRDITARKRAEVEREATQRLLASIFGVIDQALGVIDHGGHFVMINTAVTRQFGWSVFDLIGKPLTTVFETSQRAAIIQTLSKHSELEQKTQLSVPLRHRDGHISAGEIAVTTIPQPDGKQYRVMMMRHHDGNAALGENAVDPSFQQAIRKALNGTDQRGSVVAGKLQLVGLAAVRKASAERWPAIAERTFAAAEQILRRHLGPGDVFRRTADDGFLVCFAQLNEQEAQFKARVIADEISERLVGDLPEIDDAAVSSFAAKIDVEDDDTGTEADFVGQLETRLAITRKRIEETAIRAIRSCVASARVVFRAIRTDSNQLAPLSFAHLPTELEKQLNTLVALGHREFVPDAELLLLTGATERAFAEVEEDKSELILLPVRLATLTNRRQGENWLQVARNIGEPGRKRLVIEIRELSRNTARARLLEVTMMVSSMFRAVTFELPSTDPAFVANLPISTAMVTIPAKFLGDSSPGHTAKLLKTLAGQRCRLIVKDVASPTLAGMFAKAGVSLIATTYD
ncbi:MAG: PAS domain S-box protein [Azospirillaceae bacterium]|nr:PAS domain S-box protein [Azospirillaceae bacterium]